jgi:crotonobetainyl-CoA:carnitine CoA-transferase CaiB-like acyl-CoA transferase
VFARAGLDLDELAARGSCPVVLSMSAAGQRGPLADMRAYAPVMTSFSGLESLVGYEDEPHVGMITFGLGDPNAAAHALVVVLAALVRRERTGQGARIDFSQIEAMMTPLCEAFAELQLAGRDPARRGLAHPGFAPHGNFPCRGEDEWIAIAIGSDEEWRRLCDLAGMDTFDPDSRRADDAERRLAAWTAEQDRDELFARLRAAGVRAAPILRYEELVQNEHLIGRGLFQTCVHPVVGEEKIAGVPFTMSATPPRVRRAAPLVGEHTRAVLASTIGADEAAIDALEAAGVLR